MKLLLALLALPAVVSFAPTASKCALRTQPTMGLRYDASTRSNLLVAGCADLELCAGARAVPLTPCFADSNRSAVSRFPSVLKARTAARPNQIQVSEVRSRDLTA